MKEIYFDIFWLTLVLAVSDGSDGWLWRSEFQQPKTRYMQTDLISLRIVKSRLGWVGIEFVFFIFAVMLKWDVVQWHATHKGGEQ